MVHKSSYKFILTLLLGLTHQGQFSQLPIPAGAIPYIREATEPESINNPNPQLTTAPSTIDELSGSIKEHKDAEILEIIRQGLERLRHAEKRLQKFVAKIEDGIKSGVLNKTIEQVKTKIETGKIDLHKFVADLKEKKSLTLQDLIKRISDDSFLLLDKLHSRHDTLGSRIKGGLKSDTSFEDTQDAHLPIPFSSSPPAISSSPIEESPPSVK